MKKLYFLPFTILIATLSFADIPTASPVWINEIVYDNSETDTNQGIEVAGLAGTDLSTYTLTAYNGNTGANYATISLTGIIPDSPSLDPSGYGAVFFPLALKNDGPISIALDDGAGLIQFLSYGGSVTTATDGIAVNMTSIDIGFVNITNPFGASLQLAGSGNSYDNFWWVGNLTDTKGSNNENQDFGTPLPMIRIFEGPDAESEKILSPELLISTLGGIGFYFECKNVTVGSQPGDSYIIWDVRDSENNILVDGAINDVTTFLAFNGLENGKSYQISAELVDFDGNSLTPFAGYGSLITFADYTVVENLAELRTMAVGPDNYYRVSGEVINTYSRTYRARKYFQDATGGILIDDYNAIIEDPYTIGDGISNIRGTLFNDSGVLEFMPTVDWEIPTSTPQSTILPVPVVSISTLLNNIDTYESRLVQINGVSFESGNGSFQLDTNINISDGANVNDKMFFNPAFDELNYIGEPIPSGTYDMYVIVTNAFGGPFVTARNLSELTLVTLDSKSFDLDTFKIYPIPTNLGYVNISSRSNSKMSVLVYDLLGKEVINETLSNNQLNVSKLNSGLYIIKVAQDDAAITQKLIIK